MTQTSQASTSTAPAPHRHDFYAGIHKALRLALGRLLARLGNVDVADPAAIAQILADLRGQLTMSATHLKHEDEVIHAAMLNHAPQAVHALEIDHEHHRQTFKAIEAAIVAVEAAEGFARDRAMHALYIAFCAFVAEDFAHMHHEETAVMPLLQSIFSDDELRHMEHVIIASQSPDEAVVSGRAIMCALRPAERLALAAGARANMPPPVFEGMMAAITPALEPADAARLMADLAKAA